MYTAILEANETHKKTTCCETRYATMHGRLCLALLGDPHHRISVIVLFFVKVVTRVCPFYFDLYKIKLNLV